MLNETVFDQLVLEWQKVPFIDRGRTRQGADCAGFIVGFFSEYYEKVGATVDIMKWIKGVPWDSHYFHRPESAGNSKMADVLDSLPQWVTRREGKPHKGDIIGFPLGECTGGHLALVATTGGKFMHAWKGHGISLSKLSLLRVAPSFVYAVNYDL